jgi:hypothetical protein
MVNKPHPKNYPNFRSYANAVRQWYLNKPTNKTNTINLFTNSLHNYFRERGGPSNTNEIIAREVEKIYKAINAANKNAKRWIKLPSGQVGPSIQKSRKLHNLRIKGKAKNNVTYYDENKRMRELKNTIRRRTANENAVKTFNKIFQQKTGNPLGPAHNVLLKKLKTAWTPTGKFKNKRRKRPLFRNPANGSVWYMNTNGVWRNMTGPNRPNMPSKTYVPHGSHSFNYLKNVNVWQNENGSVWVYMNGKWHPFHKK